MRTLRLTLLLSSSALWVTACATAADPDDGFAPADERDAAIQILQLKAGAPVSVELSGLGTTRIVAMTPQFSVRGHATDPAQAATEFLTTHHDVFKLDAADASNFLVNGVDVEPHLNMSHVTLQRVFSGIPVFRGAITVHMDNHNGVFRALADETFKVGAPT
ncbi:MAG TPA: hypothetical protein VGD37_39320, partial [Kofleriaceae bacterium]